MTFTFTVADAIEETKRHMLGSSRVESNRLTGNMGASDTSFVVDFPLQSIQRGSQVAIDDEIILIWSVNSSSNTITSCQRAQLGTTAASHTAGAIVEVDPQFPNMEIRAALREEIRSWGPQLFRVGTATLTTAQDVRGYDLSSLPSNFYQVFDAQRSAVLTTGQTDPKSWPRVRFKVIRNADTTTFPSGNALVLSQNAWSVSPFPTINVSYSYPFDVDTAFTDTTDLIATVGLDTGFLDIAAYGAAWRLLSTKEVHRTLTQAQSQPADLRDIPAMYISNAAAALKKIRDQRLAEESLQLRSRYPYTMGF